MPIENRKKSFYLKVSQKTLMLIQICVCHDIKKTKKSEKYKWFSERHLLKLMQRLQDISLARVLCDDTVEGPKVISEVLEGAECSFHMKCLFKKRGIKQFVVTQSNVPIYGQESVESFSYSGGGHIQFDLYPEKLVVFVSLEPIRPGATHLKENTMSNSYGDAKVIVQMPKAKKDKSKYFNKDNESKLTSSVVKKQANLRSIVNKMKQLEDEKESSVNTTEDDTQSENHSANSVVIQHKNSKEEDEGISEQKSYKQDLSTCVNSSQKRLRSEVDYSEDTGSEDQLSGKNELNDKDFVVTKKPLSRKKRQKCVNIAKKDSEAKENCEQNRNNPCLDIDSISTEITSSMSKNLESSKGVLGKTSCVDLCKETNLQDYQEVIEESVDKGETHQPSGQEFVPAVVVVEEADNKKRKHETITINDVTPCFKNIKEVADLTTDHIEFLVQKLTKKLKNIFKGKEYCRRHEDYKKGGRSRGDLAFQVRFGLYSEDQHDAIMTELMSIFCARHNKYIDYLTKVLLPETFVLVYMEAFGGNHDDVERILMGNKQIESQTDGSSTE